LDEFVSVYFNICFKDLAEYLRFMMNVSIKALPQVTDKLILEGLEHPQSTKWISASVAYDWPSPDYDNLRPGAK
jgi:hypothetical protein